MIESTVSISKCVKILACAAAAAVLWTGPAARAATPADAAADGAVQQFSQATSQLYGRIQGSLVRIHIDQSPSAFLPPSMLREFQEWRRNQTNTDEGDNRGEGRQDRGGGGGRRGGGGGGGQGWNGGNMPDARGGRRGFPGGGPAGGGGGGGGAEDVPARGIPQANPLLVHRFIEQKANTLADKDPNQAASLRGLLFRIDAVRAGVTGDLYGVVIDDKGTVIVLTALLREAQPEALRVTAPDGSDTTAKFVGSHASRGYTIIQLDKAGVTTPAAFADGRPAAGSLLLAVGASNGATGWMVAPAKFGKRPADERIAMFAGDNQGGTFLFDTRGRLVALGWGRFALPMEDLNRDIQWIVENRKDVTPLQLGVRYSLVPFGPPRNPRDAAKVNAVQPGSLAEQAGLQKDDIVVSIDKRPLNQLPQIQMDLATRSGSVPMGIVRDGKELTLEMKLDSK